MANRTVRVTIPNNDPDDLVTLAESLIEKHEANPAESKLNDQDVAALKAVIAAAKPIGAKARKLKQDLQAATEQYRLAIGTGKGQTSKTKGTAYNRVVRMKKALLLAFEGEEEQLETYGMNVKIGTAKPRGPRKPKGDK